MLPLKFYQALFRAFGPQHWWPGDTAFEVIVGAILTQNTNWGNVEKAIRNLKAAKVLSPEKLHKLPAKKLAQLIKPAGFFNLKTKRLKNFLNFLFDEYDGNLSMMEKEEMDSLRKRLLGVNGIGPETADSILLYAFHKPIFVVDAYTKRFLYRHGVVEKDADYHEVQRVFSRSLQTDTRLFNEYHALIVRLGKDYCRPSPKCETCPLNKLQYSLSGRCSQCFRYTKTKCQCAKLI